MDYGPTDHMICTSNECLWIYATFLVYMIKWWKQPWSQYQCKIVHQYIFFLEVMYCISRVCLVSCEWKICEMFFLPTVHKQKNILCTFIYLIKNNVNKFQYVGFNHNGNCKLKWGPLIFSSIVYINPQKIFFIIQVIGSYYPSKSQNVFLYTEYVINMWFYNCIFITLEKQETFRSINNNIIVDVLYIAFY